MTYSNRIFTDVYITELTILKFRYFSHLSYCQINTETDISAQQLGLQNQKWLSVPKQMKICSIKKIFEAFLGPKD